ncbi:hypothetical protein GXW74_19810 [Roseomonas eburnea]|uniref:Uncharacterized protein n=1 Tax=Neoroseomonas eburnea TaxID=1346889 RepID=A0A9X9XGB2_9PROT|nr:hypothetical protein [Neoroseomonas eburnea]MBR0682748.1 hypothetical protein [Neoroseomonas eburnea]
MAPKLKEAAEGVVQNVLLTAIARLTMAIGVPVMLAAGAWAVNEIQGHDRRLGRVETEKAELIRRLAEVERRGSEESARQAARFATIEAALAGLSAQQAATLRSVERIERYLDQRSGAR